MDPVVTEAVKTKFAALAPLFDERLRRRWAAVEARSMGRGGIACLAAATGMSRTTIDTGLKELAANEAAGARDDSGRLRRPGAGRKPLTAHDPNLVQALERLVDPVTRGDPMGPLLWTCSSAARLAEHLRSAGHPVSERTVNRLLHELGYSLQANRKTLEGAQHADRAAQFKHINRRGRAFQALRQPVVSVDTKKKELVGEYRNGGREWRPKGQPERVKVHDFVDKTLGKAIPTCTKSRTVFARASSTRVRIESPTRIPRDAQVADNSGPRIPSASTQSTSKLRLGIHLLDALRPLSLGERIPLVRTSSAIHQPASSNRVPPSLYHTERGNPPSQGAPVAPWRIAERSQPQTIFGSTISRGQQEASARRRGWPAKLGTSLCSGLPWYATRSATPI